MNEDTSQQIQDIYETLPQDIKDVLSSEDTAKKLQDISTKHNLHIDQAGSLSDLTTLVMLGITPANEFVGEIKKELEISEPEATALADEVNEQILRDIKASLMKVYADDNLEEPTVPAVEDYSTLNAKDILHEIENPVATATPTAPSIPVAPMPAIPAATVSTETPTSPTAPTKLQPLVEDTGINLIENHDAPKPNLIDQKLSQTMRTPEAQKVDLSPKPVSKLPPLTNAPKGGSTGADAYREPIN